MTHTAHIQAALEAACKFGRKQYDLEHYDVRPALAALERMNPLVTFKTPYQESQAIGGGSSLCGKILWLLDNRGAMTRAEITKALATSGVREAVYKLVRDGFAEVTSGRGEDSLVTFIKHAKEAA